MAIIAENEKLSWELEDGVLLISGTVKTNEDGTETELLKKPEDGKIPDYYIGKNPAAPWDAVADQVREVEMEEGITEIGIAAFSRCSNLELAILPKSLMKIHTRAFEGCTSLADVMYDENKSFVHMYEQTEKSLKRSRSIHEKEKTQQIIVMGLRSFFNTPWAAEKFGDFYIAAGVLIDTFKDIEHLEIPAKVEEVGTYAFQNMPVKTVTFPQGIKVIGRFAFQNTQIKEIALPDSIRRIEYGAFSGTPIQKVQIAGYQFGEIDPAAFMNSNIELNPEDLNYYVVSEVPYQLEGVSRLTVIPKTVKVADVKEGRKALVDETGRKVQKIDGVIGYESAEVYTPVMKKLQGGYVLIGICVNDREKKLEYMETLCWSKKDKKPIYLKVTAAEISRLSAGNAENEKTARRISKDDVKDMFPVENALGMIKANSISPAGIRTHEEWFETAKRSDAFGTAEEALLNCWMAEHTDYSMNE